MASHEVCDLPPTPDGRRALEQLNDLGMQVRQQSEAITILLQALNGRDAEIAAVLRALATAQELQAAALRELWTEIQTTARPAPAPPVVAPR